MVLNMWMTFCSDCVDDAYYCIMSFYPMQLLQIGFSVFATLFDTFSVNEIHIEIRSELNNNAETSIFLT